MTTPRESLHQLVDALPESELRTAERFLSYLRDIYDGRDPLTRLLDEAPEDDEPLPPEEEAAIWEIIASSSREMTRGTLSWYSASCRADGLIAPELRAR